MPFPCSNVHATRLQEFDDPRDADDAVYELNGRELLGERCVESVLNMDHHSFTCSHEIGLFSLQSDCGTQSWSVVRLQQSPWVRWWWLWRWWWWWRWRWSVWRQRVRILIRAHLIGQITCMVQLCHWLVTVSLLCTN